MEYLYSLCLQYLKFLSYFIIPAIRNSSPHAVDTPGSHFDAGSGSSVGGDCKSAPVEDHGRRGRLNERNRSVSACSSSPDRESLIQRLMLKLEEAKDTIQTERE